jgi:DNA-binding MarR family transcriptional regulator
MEIFCTKGNKDAPAGGRERLFPYIFHYPLDISTTCGILVARATVVCATNVEAIFMLHCDLSIIVRGSEIFMSRCLDDFGITATEVNILMYLFSHDNPRQEDISDYFMLDKGSIAKTLRKLEDKDLISRDVNPGDQREKTVMVTEKGLCVQDVCMNLVRIWHETMFDGITGEEAAALEGTLSKIAGNVAANLDQWETLYGKVSG